MTRPPRRPGRFRRFVVGLVIIAAFFHIGGGWYFSGVIHDRALSGEQRRASLELDPNVAVAAIGEGLIVLRSVGGTDPPSAMSTDGTWGLRWDGGYGRVDEIQETQRAGVARRFSLVQGDMPAPGTEAELDARAYPDIDHVRLRRGYRDVVVKGPLGEYPAWYVPASGRTWVVLVHGNAMTRLDNARWLPALQSAGYPTLSITYRNDAGAPEDPSGLLRYGLTEWKDLEAGVRYALDEGSDGVILMGTSMGGGVIAAFLQRSKLASEVRALVLDAPMLDFGATVSDNAAREPLVGPLNVPPSLTWSAKQLAALRYDVEWEALDYLADPGIFEMSILVLHGTQDLTVPISTSERLAALRPGSVTLVPCQGADHIECWNLDPVGMQTLVVEFLASNAG